MEKTASKMPAHWSPLPDSPWPWKPIVWSINCVFVFFCLFVDGRMSLENFWRQCQSEAGFELQQKRIRKQLDNTTILSGLVLNTAAAFLTAKGTAANGILVFQLPSYACLLLSFATALGALIMGTCILFVLGTLTPTSTREVYMGSRWRVWITMLILSYPYLSIGASCCTCLLGLLISAYQSDQRLIVIGAGFVLVVPVSVGSLFLLLFFVPQPQEMQNWDV
ncbi:hypothetical protein AX17_001686 [Amanita inopinata Kibby_2008]|nr:hypothetical protein AX17_001686 [Amanita inopinata Kibby_2008]